jgi:capsular polysaccharide biosynthesis protein
VERLPTGADWVGEARASEGLRLYLAVLRKRLWVVVVVVALVVATAAFAVTRADKVYKAGADMLVTPIPAQNENLFGLGLVSQSGDPTRDAETFAKVITTSAVAERVRAELGLSRSTHAILKDVSAVPVAQSGIVTITAKAHSAAGAARLANAFGEAAIAVRTDRLHALLDTIIPRLRSQLAALPTNETAARDSLSAKLQDLETLRLLPDPTLHFETRAVAPASPSSPRPVLTIGAAFLAALVLGFGVVVGSHALDPRVEREEDLRRYRIPVLGRIPLERRRKRLWRRGPLRPEQLSRATREAFLRLAGSLAALADGGKRAIFVSGTGPADGKSTTSLNLAAALAATGSRVILVEGDARRPSLARALAATPPTGLHDVVTGRSALATALQEGGRLPPGVRMLAQGPNGAAAPAPISGEAADALVREGEAVADWLVFDGPALNYAPDALPIAKRVDSVMLVIRLGSTRTRDLDELAELLTQQGITPDGFIVIGGKPRSARY